MALFGIGKEKILKILRCHTAGITEYTLEGRRTVPVLQTEVDAWVRMALEELAEYDPVSKKKMFNFATKKMLYYAMLEYNQRRPFLSAIPSESTFLLCLRHYTTDSTRSTTLLGSTRSATTARTSPP